MSEWILPWGASLVGSSPQTFVMSSVRTVIFSVLGSNLKNMPPVRPEWVELAK